MLKFITKLRRDRAVSVQIREGQLLRNLREIRAGINASHFPQDAAHLEAKIEQLERRSRNRLEFLKTTA